jgi:hypothetical protein
VKKRWLSLTFGLIAVTAILWLLWPTDAIGPAAFDRIQLGMSAMEVEAILGSRPEKSNSTPLVSIRQERGLPYSSTWHQPRAKTGKLVEQRIRDPGCIR